MYINHAQILSNVIQSVRLKQMSYEYLSFLSLREKSPNTEFFLVRIFPHSEKTPYLDTFHAVFIPFAPNT